ncbi:hypothetical protein AB6C64_07595 [Vibrio cyclitrophicus]|uniref:hypothetical protein n=1 Tax=Vibrio cyclitrophicus TaxID=47951 RepID=UPI00067F369F|nr:hypothetical protein [Vibrio cyclitrophicus]KNH12151.1 hypothetical protein ACS79_13410 [Vibrio lentus]PME45908.1 hypothetical protein BCV35_17710 [Vibrio cyclitrophicus]
MRIIILAFAMLVTACTSQIASKQDRLQKHIGSNITDIQALYLTERSRPISFWESRNYAWVETKKPLDNLNTLHAFKDPYRDCTINWIADKSGVIQSAIPIGTMCNP